MSLVPTSRRPFQAMARHKGSVFGALGEEAQPSSEQLRKRSQDAGVGGFYPWMCIFQWSLDINAWMIIPIHWIIGLWVHTNNIQFDPFVIGCVSSMDWCIYPWLPRWSLTLPLPISRRKLGLSGTRMFTQVKLAPSSEAIIWPYS